MKNWSSVALGDIFDISRGGSPRPIQNFITDDPDGINWIMIGDTSDSSRYITSTKKRIMKSGVSKSRMVHPGDFLLTNSMSFGHPYIMKISGCIHDGWLVLSAKKNNIDQNYFYHLLGSNNLYSEFSRRAAGTTVKNLNINLVSGVKVNLPPLEEQKRIAAILDKADSIRRKRKDAIALTEELLRSTFLDMFGDPVTNPKGWEIKQLENLLAEPFQNGAYFPKEKYSTSNNSVEMVHMSDAFYGVVKTGHLKRVLATAEEIKKYEVITNDVLINRRSLNYEGAAKPCLISTLNGPLIFESSLIRVRVNQKVMDPIFFFSYMLQPQARAAFVFPFVTQSTISGINQAGLKKIKVIVPPIDLQLKYKQIYQKTTSSISNYKNNFDRTDNLFNSLLQKAFRGEL
ncbi:MULTISPECIES: restriction endonuclease subunit S [unclassified Moorena]|uniref:restriction endonuclease subunit S n=1 Tax=unclassified Moorena TaxID=2683338 RepID=UPI001400559D|nr:MULTISPECIES: restriction endonuclease subunit S [unclassified Moorena]NEO11080.1 restriction endonuclease subunit S [Moorena sp. SIO3E8]NEQ00868.1 restriction endonuclease subunit S [Moorena sp. SIO3F7]